MGGGASGQIDIGGAVASERGDVEVGEELSAVPRLPEEDALSVAGEGDDEVVSGGEFAALAIGVLILGHQIVIPTDTEERSIIGGEEDARMPEPGQEGSRGGCGRGALFAEEFEGVGLAQLAAAVVEDEGELVAMEQDGDDVGWCWGFDWLGEHGRILSGGIAPQGQECPAGAEEEA